VALSCGGQRNLKAEFGLQRSIRNNVRGRTPVILSVTTTLSALTIHLINPWIPYYLECEDTGTLSLVCCFVRWLIMVSTRQLVMNYQKNDWQYHKGWQITSNGDLMWVTWVIWPHFKILWPINLRNVSNRWSNKTLQEWYADRPWHVLSNTEGDSDVISSCHIYASCFSAML